MSIYCNPSADPNMIARYPGSGANAHTEPDHRRVAGVPRHARWAAGEDNTSDIMKCQLKPPVRGDYTVTFTDTEWARLLAAFPAGVCDYSQRGIGQDTPPAQWHTFENGPGGQPLGNPPVSQQFR